MIGSCHLPPCDLLVETDGRYCVFIDDRDAGLYGDTACLRLSGGESGGTIDKYLSPKMRQKSFRKPKKYVNVMIIHTTKLESVIEIYIEL